MTTTTYRRAAVVGLSVVGCLTLAACGTSTGPSTPGGSTTGVLTGGVTAGPTCPVERVGHPCPPTPVVAVEVQATAAGRIVASTHSGADGTYKLELPGGTYSIDAVTENMLPRCVPRTVTVTAAHATSGDITCDTGIR